MRYWIGVDCGSTSIKAGLYDANGREIGTARKNLAVISARPGWAERDPELVWQRACDVIRELLSTTKIPAPSIAGLGISAQGKGICLLDKAGQPLGNIILSSDQRALELVRRWQQEDIPTQLYPKTLQTLWTGHPASLLRWLKDHEPDRYAQIGSVLMSHDYLRYRLTGELGCEITNISESNLFNMRENRYDEDLASLLGIEGVLKAFPRIVGSAEVVGSVTPDAANLTGLLAGTPVVGGLFDVVATCLCAGITHERQLNAVMGTWSVTTGVTPNIVDGMPHPFVYGRHAEPGYYIVHEASPTSAANLEWLTAQFGGMGYAQINALVARLDKAASSVQFLPFLYGSNAGLGMKSGFYGLQALHGIEHLLQAVFEGVIFSHMRHLSRLRLRFPKVESLRVTGGPAHSAVWMQVLADVSGLRVELPQIDETGCLGAALCAAVGSGEFADFWQAMHGVQIPIETLEPDLAMFEPYQKKRRRYSVLLDSLAQYESKCREMDANEKQGE